MTNLQFDLSGLREQAVVALERRLEAAETQPLLADSAVLTSPLVAQLSVARHESGATFSGTVEGNAAVEGLMGGYLDAMHDTAPPARARAISFTAQAANTAA